MTKQKKKPRPGRKPKRTAAGAVAVMAASGMCEDQIALRLNIHKNTLRAQHIDELIKGRAVAAASKGSSDELTDKEQELLDRIRRAFDSKWYNERFGCVVYFGARTIGEAYEICRSKGMRSHPLRPFNELPTQTTEQRK
jgi:hypothetical protein